MARRPQSSRPSLVASLFSRAAFYRSVHELSDLPPDESVELAFAGRSNTGKSSAINAILNRGRLAFVSKTPGRTQLINFFSLGEGRFLVDLPGYGFAGVPLDIKEHWGQLLSSYIALRRSLAGLIVVMDARRPLTPLDEQMLQWFAPTRKPVHILLAKSDKLGRAQANKALRDTIAALGEHCSNCSAQLFSNVTGEGLEQAQMRVAQWLGLRDAQGVK